MENLYKNLCVLVIDDTDIVREVIALYLEHIGFTVHQASDGRQGIELFEKFNPDIVFTDLLMPEIDGLEVVKTITKQNPETPIVVISGNNDAISATEALRIGAWDYITKPVAEFAVIDRVVSQMLIRAQKIKVENANAQKDREVREVSEKLKLILDSTVEAIYGIDLNGNCTFCNSACLKITGYANLGHIIGRNMHSLIHHSHADRSQLDAKDCQIFKSFRNGVEIHVDDEVFWHFDGTSFPVEYWANAIWKEGQLIGAVITFIDITERKAAEAEKVALQRTLERLLTEQQVMFSTLPIGVIFLKNRIVQVTNPAFDHIFGHEKGESIGEKISKIYADNKSYERIGDEGYKTLSSGNVYKTESEMKKKDGSKIWCSIVGRAVNASEPEEGSIWMIQDITEQKQNQKKLLQLSSAVENSPASIVITDHLGCIEYVNPKFTGITGYSLNEAIGLNPRILNSGIQPKETYSELWQTITEGYEWRGDFCNKKKNGELYWERASISPIRDIEGNITNFVAIKEDFTEEKKLTEELVTAQKAAHNSNRAKSEFLANMSHEIRTPLNAIIGFASLALNTNLPPKEHDYIQKIHTAGELLLNVIGDILDFSKVEARQLKMEHIPFKLSTTLETTMGMVQEKALDKGFKIRLNFLNELPACLVGDPFRFGQILTNLLNNAVKFTTHGEVVIELLLTQQKADRIQIKVTVRDSGIGIAPEQISNLFQPFTQADGSTTRRFGGTGLGLSISKQLVELMDGEIWCESQPKQGSSFSFTAWFGVCHASKEEQVKCADDCNKNQSNNGLDRTETLFDFSKCHLLLVEDNDTNRQLAIELLKDTGIKIDIAVNGQEALTMVTNGDKKYDLVLMDIQMPIMDGYEATLRIRSDKRFTYLPIIAMTAHAMQEEQQKILEAGIDAHITKPINIKAMLRVMRFFLLEQDTSKQLNKKIEDKADELLEIPHIRGLAVAEALNQLDGNKKLYLWVLRSFLEKQSNDATLIAEALDAGDENRTKFLLHTLKGIAGSIGASVLKHLVQTVENCIINKDPKAVINDAFKQFSAEFNQLTIDIREHLNIVPENRNTADANTIDLKIVAQILNQLLEYIVGNNGKAERYLDDYQKELAGLSETEMANVKRHLSNFDFTAAESSLMAIATDCGIILTRDCKP